MLPRQIIMLIGVWVIVFLFLGIPIGWKQAFAVLTGLAIIFLAYRLPAPQKSTDEHAIPFVEHKSDSRESAPETSVSDVTIPEETQPLQDITKTDQSTTL